MGNKNDDFGNRMKYYEGREAQDTFMVGLPLVVRIDGRRFSKFTRPFKKPFDPILTEAMQNVTKRLVEETSASIGYTQSDEITLVLDDGGYESEIFFGGRKQKLVSVLASMATAFFIRELDALIQNNMDVYGPLAAELGLATPHFDARVWQVPTREEAANAVLWRAKDAMKNSVSAAARTIASPSEMHGKSTPELLQMMLDRGVVFYEAYSKSERQGTYYQRKVAVKEIDDETWNQIPPHVRNGMDRSTLRSSVEQLDIEFFGAYMNRAAIIFEQAAPIRSHV